MGGGGNGAIRLQKSGRMAGKLILTKKQPRFSTTVSFHKKDIFVRISGPPKRYFCQG